MDLTSALFRSVMMFAIVTSTGWYSGCSGGENPIAGRTVASGAITLDGQPMKGGSITFKSGDPSGVQTTCMIYDGKYVCDRVPLGENLVSVDTEFLLNGNAAAYVKIPAKYNNPKSSGLTANFKEGENKDVNFALTSEE